MKSQKAKEFIDGCMAHLTVEMSDHAKWQLRAAMTHAAELAEQEMEGFYTCWIDPKEEQPENNVCVLIKVADKFGNSAIYLGSREGNEYLTDGGFEFEIDCNDESSSEMKVIGWREMM